MPSLRVDGELVPVSPEFAARYKTMSPQEQIAAAKQMKTTPGGGMGIPAAGTPFATDQPPSSTGTGMLQSLATGVRNAGEAIAAAPGDLVDWEARQVEKIMPDLGRTWRTGQDQPAHGPAIATTPDVRAATDKAYPDATSKTWTRHQPQGTAEEYAETAGEFLPVLLSPGSWPGKVAGWLGASGATETAGQAAREVAPEYEDAVRLVTGFLTTMGTARTLPNFKIRRAMKQIGDAGPEAIKRVQDRLIAEGLTPEQAAAKMKELGPEAMPMDVGPNLRQEGQQTMTRGGEGRTVLDTALRGREDTANQRLQPDIRANVGPEVDRLATLQALKDRAAEVGEQYPAAKQNQVQQADLSPVAAELDAEILTARGAMKSNLQKVRDMLDDPRVEGGYLDTTSEGVHAVRVELDNMIKAADPGSPLGARLSGIRDRISGELKDVSPDIKALDEQYSGIKREGEAFETGEQLLDKGRSTLSPDEFQRTYDAMSPGEQAHIRKGMTREIDRLTGVNINDRVKLKNLISGDDPASWNFGKIKTVIGEEAATKLMSALRREATFNETYSKVVQGSKTAESLPQDIPRKPGVVDAASDLLLGGGPGKLKQLVKEKVLGGDPSISPDVNAQVARLLTSNRPDDMVLLANLLQKYKPNAGGPDVLRALLARQAEIGDR